MDIPLIHTIKGNLPVSDLDYKEVWENDEHHVTFRQSYFLNGELVRQNVHMLAKHGNEAVSIATALV